MADFPFPSIAFVWPALAAASVSEAVSAVASEFAHLAAGEEAAPAAPEPRWATPNKIVLELPTMRLRDFSTGSPGMPTLICAPFALHGATIADFARRHSLVAALQAAGLDGLFVTDWRSATPDMRFFSIDSYLAELNVAIDALGGQVNLVGLCQGGWMALLYGARFTDKVRKLVLAGAPVDIAAGESWLSRIAKSVPMSVFRELVQVGDGRVLGQRVLALWAPTRLDIRATCEVLQVPQETLNARNRQLQIRFNDWFAWTVNLPGTFYLQVVEWLYKQNRLAEGRVVALGRRADLSSLRIPTYLLAARDDELVSPDQVFATARRIGTPAAAIKQAIAPCRHLGLFMGAATLQTVWPEIARWLANPQAL